MTKGTDTRSAILDNAANLASLMGLNGLTIGTLADHTGMSKSGLFRHFGSKEALQLATLRAGVARFTEVVVRPALKAPRGEARVRALFDGWIEWETDKGLAGGCIFIAASAEMDDQPGEVRDYLVTTQREWLDLIARTAGFAMGVGAFRPDLDVEQFSYEFNAVMLGFHQAHRLMRDVRAIERARAQVDRLLADARAPDEPMHRATAPFSDDESLRRETDG